MIGIAEYYTQLPNRIHPVFMGAIHESLNIISIKRGSVGAIALSGFFLSALCYRVPKQREKTTL